MLLSHLVGLLKQDMFHQTFFSQNKTFKTVWREKPLFQTPSFLISYIFNVVQAQSTFKYYLLLFTSCRFIILQLQNTDFMKKMNQERLHTQATFKMDHKTHKEFTYRIIQNILT